MGLALLIVLSACADVQQQDVPSTGAETPESATATEGNGEAPAEAPETAQADDPAAVRDAPLGRRGTAPVAQPADPRAGESDIELRRPEAGEPKQVVGLLLPLSGSRGPLGESMLRAAELALFDVATANFELVVRDTKGTPEGAKTAARSAIDAGANLLLGPVFAGSVKAVKPVADGGQVPVLAFSNNPRVAEPGAWIMGLMPGQQVRRVVSHAVSQGRRRYAALAPNNTYGSLVVQALRGAVRRYGASLVDVKFYPPGSQDVSEEVKALARTGLGGMPDAAILLPAGGKQLQTLAPTLPFFDIDPDTVRFLGTTLWNDPSLGTEPALVGGWFAAPPPSGRDEFRKRYRETFNGAPRELASLAYDATALAALLARQAEQAGDPPPAAYAAERLTQRNGFAGVDGVFRLNDDGTVQRLYAVLEMARNELRVVGPAPDRFEPQIN